MSNRTILMGVLFLVGIIMSAAWYGPVMDVEIIQAETNVVNLSQLKKEFRGDERVLDAINDLINLRSCKYDIILIKYVVEDIVEVVADGLISWEILGTNEIELDFFIEQARINGAQEDVVNLRNCEYGIALTKYVVEDIVEVVADGLISWEELGVEQGERGLRNISEGIALCGTGEWDLF
ncbi:hypothetical protein ACFL08_02160 [Patescibacteria group bacterium]